MIKRRNQKLLFILKVVNLILFFSAIGALAFGISPFDKLLLFFVLMIGGLTSFMSTHLVTGQLIINPKGLVLENEICEWKNIKIINLYFSKPKSSDDVFKILFHFNEFGIGSYIQIQLNNNEVRNLEFYLLTHDQRDAIERVFKESHANVRSDNVR